ncbi:MAG: phosphoribosylanthranilate isomerase [Bacteroidaceae bacterium]|nr:phosphoribosylanthranilate isomerase [Bacteroidaceae bacterium]
MIVKVCGMRDTDNIRQIDELGCVDWMGFIFYPHSPRFVSEIPTYLPQHCKRVGAFVNEPIQDILERVKTFGFNIIQLHGNETPDYCKQLRSCINKEVKIIKMIPITIPSDLDETKRYEGIVDYFLFETRCSIYGGCGKQFDWNILEGYKGHIPFLLTGGIKPTDAEKVLSFHHPQFVGIDLNSKFETAPAIKDPMLLRTFLSQINHSSHSIH